MALIFKDNLQTTDSTGLYTLKAQIGGQWTDVHTVAGATSGTVTVNDSHNTIEVDTSIFPVGKTFPFKWVDTLGNESNVSNVLIPFKILDHYSATENISYTNNGGDSWTFTIPYTPPPNDLTDILSNKIFFYSDSGVTTLVNDGGVTNTRSYPLSGNGAGTYMVEALYLNSAGQHINIATLFVMVNDAGVVLRELQVTGFSDISYTGMNLSCKANYVVVNASVEMSGYMALDGTFNNQQWVALGNPLTDQPLPAMDTPIIIIAFGIQLDPAQWTAGVAADGNMVGCVMTLLTNIA